MDGDPVDGGVALLVEGVDDAFRDRDVTGPQGAEEGGDGDLAAAPPVLVVMGRGQLGGAGGQMGGVGEPSGLREAHDGGGRQRDGDAAGGRVEQHGEGVVEPRATAVAEPGEPRAARAPGARSAAFAPPRSCDPPGGDVERDERLVEVAVAVVRDPGAQRGRPDHESHGGRVGPGGLAQGVEDVDEVTRGPACVVQVPPGVGALQRERGATQVTGLRPAQGGREQTGGGVGLLELERGVDRGVEPGRFHRQVAVQRQGDGPDEPGAGAVPAVGQAGDAFEHLTTTRPRDPRPDRLGVERVGEVDRDVPLARDRQPR